MDKGKRVREHSALNDKIPFEHLKQQLPDIDDKIRYVQPFLLASASVKLESWSGYTVLAQTGE